MTSRPELLGNTLGPFVATYQWTHGTSRLRCAGWGPVQTSPDRIRATARRKLAVSVDTGIAPSPHRGDRLLAAEAPALHRAHTGARPGYGLLGIPVATRRRSSNDFLGDPSSRVIPYAMLASESWYLNTITAPMYLVLRAHSTKS